MVVRRRITNYIHSGQNLRIKCQFYERSELVLINIIFSFFVINWRWFLKALENSARYARNKFNSALRADVSLRSKNDSFPSMFDQCVNTSSRRQSHHSVMHNSSELQR